VSSSTDTASVTLHVADGTAMKAYVARPKSGSATAGMLVFQEAFGVNAYMRDVTDRFAALGFLAISPELFHRTAPPGFEGSYTDFEAIRPHVSALRPDGLNTDIDAAYNWLREQGVDAPRIGAIGFCMGGRVAYMANARVQLGAAISFYGGGIAPDLLGLAQAQRAPILMFWGGLDTHIPPDHYRAVADALTAAQAIHEQVVFSRADHGFYCNARASYNEGASRQATALVNAFLDVYGLL